MEAKKLNVQKEESYFEEVVTDIFRRNDKDVDGTLTVKEYNVYEHDELQLLTDIAFLNTVVIFYAGVGYVFFF